MINLEMKIRWETGDGGKWKGELWKRRKGAKKGGNEEGRKEGRKEVRKMKKERSWNFI